MKYVIIEDERPNAELLSTTIQQIDEQAALLKILPSIEESKAWFSNHPMPDVVFMDIRLEDGLSFELFQSIQFTCPVIFTTAYDEYALQAFKVYGAAYLLKPILKTELQEAIAKTFHSERMQDEVTMKEMISALLANKATYKKQFLIHYKDQLLTIPVQQIDYIYVEHKLTYFCLVSGLQYHVPYTLEELEQQLNPQDFFRVNRQYIISMGAIESIHKYFNEKAKIILKRNKEAELIVSRLRLPYFKAWLDQ